MLRVRSDFEAEDAPRGVEGGLLEYTYMLPLRGAVNGIPLGGLLFLFFGCFYMAWISTLMFRMTEYGYLFLVAHIGGPPRLVCILVNGHFRMLYMLMNIRF